MRMRMRNERGFTLPELLVVIVVCIGLLTASMLFLRPKSYATEDKQAQRRLGISVLAQSLKEFRAQEGRWPAGIPVQETPITNVADGYDLCVHLVPDYLKDLPLDPQVGVEYTGPDDSPVLSTAGCNAKDVKYYTGYTIRITGDNEVVLGAPPTGDDPIEVTIR